MKTVNARVAHMHDIEANWKKCLTFVPAAGEEIVYEPDDNHEYSRLKIGDGVTNVNNLPFVTADASNALDDVVHWDDEIGLIDGGKITS